jgi:serine protease DegS
MYALQRFFIALLKPIMLGLIVAAILLVLIPEFRQGSGLNVHWLQKKDTPPERLSYYDAISRSAPAVAYIYGVSIDNPNPNSIFRSRATERTNLGSGVVMREDGYLMTCYHVIKDTDTIFIRLQDSRTLEAQIVGFDVETDLAVLKVDAQDLHVMPQVPKTGLRVGDVVMAIGNPLDLGQTITQGIVSRISRNNLANYFDFIQTDAVLHPGNSGGALVDSNGYLVGITNANFKTRGPSGRGLTTVDGINFAVPYELAKKVMEEIIVSGTVVRGQLGFSGNPLIERKGMIVTEVTRGGPADNAGLKVKDILLAINGFQIEENDAGQALNIVSQTTPGTKLTLRIERNEQLITLTVIVGSSASS